MFFSTGYVEIKCGKEENVLYKKKKNFAVYKKKRKAWLRIKWI